MKKIVSLIILILLLTAPAAAAYATEPAQPESHSLPETEVSGETTAATKAESEGSTEAYSYDGNAETAAATKEEQQPNHSNESAAATESESELSTEASTLPAHLTGNGTVISSERAEDGKVFYTIEADDGTVFYLIIDNNGIQNNVYFLTPITKDNLASVAKSKKDSSSSISSILFPAESELSTEAASMPTNPTQGNFLSRNWNIILIFTVAVIVFVIMYFKKIKNKKPVFAEGDDDELEESEPEENEPEDTDYEEESEEE